MFYLFQSDRTKIGGVTLILDTATASRQISKWGSTSAARNSALKPPYPPLPCIVWTVWTCLEIYSMNISRALYLWMGMWAWRSLLSRYQISTEEYQCYQLVQCQTMWSLRWRDLWPLCYINRCYRSVPKEVFICDELKVKKICFQTLALLMLNSSTTFHHPPLDT